MFDIKGEANPSFVIALFNYALYDVEVVKF